MCFLVSPSYKKAVCKSKGRFKKMRYQTYFPQDVAQLHKTVRQNVEAIEDERKWKWNHACRSKRKKYNFRHHEQVNEVSRDSSLCFGNKEEMEEIVEETDFRNDVIVFSLKEAIDENANGQRLQKYNKWKTGQGIAIPNAVSNNCVKLRGKRNVIYIDNPCSDSVPHRRVLKRARTKLPYKNILIKHDVKSPHRKYMF